MNARPRTTAFRFIPLPTSIAALRRRAVLAALVAAVLGARPAPGAVALGFLEEFPGTSTSSWAGGTAFSNPGIGGYLGAGDGYLHLENSVVANLGCSGLGPEYGGNWTAAGITQVRMWLNDVGADQALEMHLSIGDGNQASPTRNFWQHDAGFIPPLNAWGEYVVSLTSGGAGWTRILGTGTFAAALTVVDRLHIRHDLAPFLPIPNPPEQIAGDVGVDHVLLTNGLVGVNPFDPRVTHPVELAPPYPNPSRGPVSVALVAADAGPVAIEIVDAAGRSVRRARLADAGGGARVWLWDGRDDAGRRVSAGYYRVRATGPSGGMSRPIVRIE